MSISNIFSSIKPQSKEQWLWFFLFIISTCSLLGMIEVHMASYTRYIASFLFWCTFFSMNKSMPCKGLSGVIYVLLLLWTLYVTFFTFTENPQFFHEAMLGSAGTIVWPYLIVHPLMIPHFLPFVLLTISATKGPDLNYIFKLAGVLVVLYLCMYPFSFWNMTHYHWSMDTVGEWGEAGTYSDFVNNSTMGISALLPPTVMIFLYRYLPNKTWRKYILVHILELLLVLYLARRGRVAISMLTLVAVWGLYTFMDKKRNKFSMVVIALLVAGIGYFMFTQTADTFLSTLMQRGLEDSRSGVEESFLLDMARSDDWFVGRGWFGQYWDPGFGKYRSSIETGWMKLVLRGGVIYLALYLAFFIMAVFKGLFSSNNILVKAFATVLVIHIISLYPAGYPSYDINYMMLWLGAICCLNPNLRQMTDQEIQQKYFLDL